MRALALNLKGKTLTSSTALDEINSQTQRYCIDLLDGIRGLDHNKLSQAILMVVNAISCNKQIFLIGNGGSALTASHMATDWSKGIFENTGQRCSVRSLSDNAGIVTALANDVSYEGIFSEQLRSLMDPGDLLIAISGSGNSANVVAGIECAKILGATTLGLVGFGGGKISNLADFTFCTETHDMQVSEDIHLMFCHMVFKACCSIFTIPV